MSETIVFKNGERAVVETYESTLLREHYFRVKHPSGLSVYLFPKEHSTLSALYAVRFGATNLAYRYEGDAEDTVIPVGTAHFLEHKMFEMEDGSDAFQLFSELGADANAYTAWDKTAYLFYATEKTEECLSALLSFVSHPYFTDETVKKEQGIIAEEIRMNAESPVERCFMNLLSAMYRENAIRYEICGSEESIGRITPRVLYGCCEAFYRPSNMALVVSGGISLPDLMRVVDDVLPSVPREEKRVIPRDENRNETAAVRVPYIEEKMPVGKPVFLIGIKDHAAVSLPSRERMRRDALMSLVKEMYFSTSSELYNRLFDEGVISPTLASAYGATSLYAFFEIGGESDDPKRVLSEVKETLRLARETGVDRVLFERARRVLYAKAVKSFDSTKTISEMLLDYLFSDYELFEYVSLLQTVTREEVEALLATAFPDEAFTLSVISPLSRAEL